MNERIKELWEDSDTIQVRYPEQGSPVSVSEQTLEKFAELIVLECSSICYKGLENGDEAASLLMNTFGVEE
jgi:hypothetical protein